MQQNFLGERAIAQLWIDELKVKFWIQICFDEHTVHIYLYNEWHYTLGKPFTSLNNVLIDICTALRLQNLSNPMSIQQLMSYLK